MEKEAEVKKNQFVNIKYRTGVDENGTEVIGYQVGGGVIALTLPNFSTVIIPLDTVAGVVIFNKE